MLFEPHVWHNVIARSSARHGIIYTPPPPLPPPTRGQRILLALFKYGPWAIAACVVALYAFCALTIGPLKALGYFLCGFLPVVLTGSLGRCRY